MKCKEVSSVLQSTDATEEQEGRHNSQISPTKANSCQLFDMLAGTATSTNSCISTDTKQKPILSGMCAAAS